MKLLLPFLGLLVLLGCSEQERMERMNWQEVRHKCSEEGYESLSEPEQVWCGVRALIDATNDGGLVSYFYNNWADEYDDTTYALGVLEAFEALDLLESYAAFFGEEVPSDINERNDIVNSWVDGSPASKAREDLSSQLESLLDPLEEHLHAYLIDNGITPDYGN